jgi:hypothetical protein
MNNAELAALIKNAEPNAWYNLEHPKYGRFKIDFSADGYSWTIDKNNPPFRWVYPLQGNYVKFFKTESGAKRSLAKKLKCYNEYRGLK